MLVLPDTPILPLPVETRDQTYSEIAIKRQELVVSKESKNELIKFALKLEEYLEELFRFAVEQSNAKDLTEIIAHASSVTIFNSKKIPWSNIVSPSEGKLSIRKVHSSYSWTLLNEILAAIISISTVYLKLGALTINNAIEGDPAALSNEEINEIWKQIINRYKSSIAFSMFGSHITKKSDFENSNFHPSIFSLLQKIGDLNIQMSILIKSSWINRYDFSKEESFKTENNGTLSRVAIFITDELKVCEGVIQNLSNEKKNLVLNFRNWTEYLGIFGKYVAAYAGMFLAIENYQQKRLGHAIGLIEYSLVCLQSKGYDSAAGNKKLVSRLKGKVSARKNEHFIKDIQSVSTLRINNSAFTDASGVLLEDLCILFDQLVLLHLKFKKQNDNIYFDNVVGWQNIKEDSKWPIGSRVPMTGIQAFEPKALMLNSMGNHLATTSANPDRGAYY
ncbi:Piso0_005796 [Millerozyma farinosa CBS 7064]|uniref:Piso0_005796 protein n=1 Tax=Pichia sorbitophila (strain ATCC MYA-4447 / BCRC 22081 / CBS 7064 / NBRC 10061 / NRRL Y-12695) TaxID=559304 RepID=G8XZZ4_PICSO|nr:Piso0_005796 [Millerozyma farinosa CBS 7064]